MQDVCDLPAQDSWPSSAAKRVLAKLRFPGGVPVISSTRSWYKDQMKHILDVEILDLRASASMQMSMTHGQSQFSEGRAADFSCIPCFLSRESSSECSPARQIHDSAPHLICIVFLKPVGIILLSNLSRNRLRSKLGDRGSFYSSFSMITLPGLRLMLREEASLWATG